MSLCNLAFTNITQGVMDQYSTISTRLSGLDFKLPVITFLRLMTHSHSIKKTLPCFASTPHHAPSLRRRLFARSGSGGDAVEAIVDLLSIARLPPGHDPGAGYGVATAVRQRWHLAIRYFGLFGGLLVAAND